MSNEIPTHAGAPPGGRRPAGGDLLPSDGTVRRARGKLHSREVPSLWNAARAAASRLPTTPFRCLATAAAVVLCRYAEGGPVSLHVEEEDGARDWTARLDKGTAATTLPATLEDAPTSSGRPSGICLSEGDAPDHEANVVLAVSGDRVRLSYDPGVIADAAADRLVGHLEMALEALRREPDTCPTEWEILTSSELHRLDTWNDTSTAYDLDSTFYDRFDAQACRTPDAVAAEEPGRSVTYAQLQAEAASVAAYLARRGVGPETVVGLMIPRGVDALAAVVAVFRLGAAYFPLDHSGPPHRTGLALDQGQPDLCLVDRDLLPTFRDACRSAGTTFEALILDEAQAEDARFAPSGVVRSPDDLAYILSTSGSTGIPKATMIEQRGMVNHALGLIDLLGMGSQDVLAQNAPLTFDISVWQMITPLMVGGRVSFVPDDMVGDPDRLLGWARDREVTILQIVPSLMASILQLTEYDAGISLPPSLRWVIPTGEALPVDIARHWLERFPRPPLLNAYGPAECSDDVTVQRVERPPSGELASMPIGRPLPNVSVYVLDRNGQRVPVGVVGEICVGGTGVGRGYRNDPERTARSFDANPYPPFGRLYRTGDLGRFLEDGSLQYAGRVDHQVKVGGIRIELGEVETALEQHPRIRRAVAMAPNSRLVAYTTTVDSRPVGPDEMRAFLAERLPDYMVPRAFVHLDELPLNPNGKVDRKRLPDPAAAHTEPGPSSEPATETEQRLLAIWEELLGHPVGADDDFFAQGGTSLLAAVMLWRVRRELGADLPISTPATAPTVRTLAPLVDGSTQRRTHLVPLRQGRGTPLFLAPGQGGSILGFVKLARHMESDRPVWGLDLQRRREEPAHPQTFPALVERYLTAMRTIQPHGPYLVGGWCLGGEVAYEIARRLRQEGDEAALVVLLQTDNVDYPRYPPGTGRLRRAWLALADRGAYEAEMLRSRSGIDRLRYLRDDILAKAVTMVRVPLEALAAPAFRRLGVPFRGSDEYHQRRWSKADGAAYQGYSFGPYPGDVLQIRAHHQPRGIVPDPSLGWSDLVEGRLDLVEVDGYHWNFLREPIVRQVAAELDRRLDQVDPPKPPDPNRGGDI
ncbi:MAG: non-ribosomal peptide synthetase [Actinomycetota bacterium]